MLFPDEFIFEQALADLAVEIQLREPPAINPLSCDRWVARSCLQKAIRRTEPGLAQRALANLFLHDPRAVWRHLVIIALEDVGTVNIDLLTQITAARGSKPWRNRMGGDWVVMAELVRQMAISDHCQAACDLLLKIQNDDSLIDAREYSSSASVRSSQEALCGNSSSIVEKGIAALSIAGELRVGQEVRDPAAVFDLLTDHVPVLQDVITCRAAWKISRNPMAMLLPLISERWVAARPVGCIDDELPSVQKIGLIPGYALDQFTRIGNQVARAFLREDDFLRTAMSQAQLPQTAHPRAVGDLLFLQEGGLISKRVVWETGDALRLPIRHLSIVSKLGDAIPIILDHIESKAPLIAELRQQFFHR